MAKKSLLQDSKGNWSSKRFWGSILIIFSLAGLIDLYFDDPESISGRLEILKLTLYSGIGLVGGGSLLENIKINLRK